MTRRPRPDTVPQPSWLRWLYFIAACCIGAAAGGWFGGMQ